ncbi:MAG: prolipoprotein diacylglyceryl transferase [Actinomycetota bacterium]|jgi:phosphatidylglycerol---prolipoprotein diacylglyceryl transferase
MLGAISYTPIVDIDIGPLTVSPHGIGIAVGFLIGARFMLPRSRARGIPDDLVYPLFTLAAIGAIVGARVAYVMNHFSSYESPADALRVWEGGISLIGGMFGAILFAMPKIKKSKLSFWKVMDSAAPGMALGVMVGRIGDLVVADHLGKTTDFFLGYRCPPIDVATASPCAPTEFASRTVGAVVHQTALYDLIFAGIILVVLLAFEKRKRFEGFLIMTFGAGYGIARIIEDFLREDLRRFGLTGSQWVAIAVLTIALVNLLVLRRSPRWGHWDEGGDAPAPEDQPTLGDEQAEAAEPAVVTEPEERT